jgi:hypothetical protein
MPERGARQARRRGARLARLKRQYADHYPSIPARFWTEAANLAQLVTTREALTEADKALPRCPLPDLYFEFRGGTARASGAEVRTRLGDRQHRRSGSES